MNRSTTHRVRVALLLAACTGAAGAQLTHNAAWTVDSGQGASGFGYAVASAGDVNGDGFGDVVVGAPSFSNGQSWEGRAYLYKGSATGLATSPAWTVESNVTFEGLGIAVSGAGDVNGDGFDDVLVGSNGKASLFLGSAAGLAASAAWTATMATTSFGASLAGLGDINGDGFDDVAVSAASFTGGSVFIYHGSAGGLPASPTTTRNAPVTGSGFGHSVSGAGDVNGDGYADVIVGAHVFSGNLANEGAAYLYLGSAAGLGAAPAWNAAGGNAGALFGLTVARAGDVDGDGYGDVVIGAPHFDDGLWEEGQVLLYRGNATGLEAQPAWTARGDQGTALFGESVAFGGDVNGDGYDDVLVGADGYSDAPANYVEGRLFVFLGSATGPETTPAWYGPSNATKPFIGGSVAGGFDGNGDGFADAIGGGQNFDSGAQAVQGFYGGHYASVAPYGVAKPLPAQYAPRLRSLAAPKLGGTASIDIGGGEPLAGGIFLFAGLQPAALPFDGGTVHLLPFTTLFLGSFNLNGAYTLPAAIPATPSLQGADLFLQAGYVHPQATGNHHTVLTNALRWQLGV